MANWRFETRKAKFLAFLQMIGLLMRTSALLAPPVADNLLGPGQCPAGSFCIDTNYCSNEYFTTKAGQPFYCGPHQQIDSKICCVSLEAEPSVPETLDRNPRNTQPSHDALPDTNGDSAKSKTFEDDEVDILSLPFSTSADNTRDDISLTEDKLSDHDQANNGLNNLEGLLEDAFEQEVNPGQHSAPISRSSYSDPLDEHFFNSFEPNFGQPVGFNEVHQVVPNRESLDRLPVLGQTFSIPVLHPEESLDMALGGRVSTGVERGQICQCEKGDPGPKGDPGEPGKIIYIPVFVNTAGYPIEASGANNGITASIQPGSVTSPTPTGINPSYQHQNMFFGQNPSIPQHPNPTVLPYNVPVNIQPGATPSQYQILSQQPSGISAPASVQYSSVLKQAAQQPPTHQTHPSVAFAEGLQARLTRHASDNKFRQRRY